MVIVECSGPWGDLSTTSSHVSVGGETVVVVSDTVVISDEVICDSPVVVWTAAPLLTWRNAPVARRPRYVSLGAHGARGPPALRSAQTLPAYTLLLSSLTQTPCVSRSDVIYV